MADIYQELVCKFHGSTRHKFGFCLLCMAQSHEEDALEYIEKQSPVPNGEKGNAFRPHS